MTARSGARREAGAQPAEPRLIGRYALFSEIAAGGMASVHLGRLLGPVGFARLVAIKRLHPHFARDPEFVAMFLDEARIAARIRHPNVVQTLDVVAADGELFLVMDYVEGESLSRLLAAQIRAHGRPPSSRIIAAVMAGALHGLHAAHEAKGERGEALGVVHRDVSPQNILVGTDGVPRVLDFGIAKAIRRTQTTYAGQLKGKLAYMAPEQVRFNRSISRRTDVYAASVVLWECVTGCRLFTGDEAEIVSRILKGDVPPPSRMDAGVPPALEAVVMRGIDADPDARFETAREMALALERAVGLASATELTEWVTAIAAGALSKRTSLVQELEAAGDATGPASSDPAPAVRAPIEHTEDLPTRLVAVAPAGQDAAPPRAPSWGSLALFGAIAAGASAAVAGALLLSATSRGPSLRADAGVAAVATSAFALAPVPPPEPAVDVPPQAPDPPVEEPSAAPARSAPVPASRPRPRPAPAGSCEPPFFYDGDGLKRYKAGCVH